MLELKDLIEFVKNYYGSLWSIIEEYIIALLTEAKKSVIGIMMK